MRSQLHSPHFPDDEKLLLSPPQIFYIPQNSLPKYVFISSLQIWKWMVQGDNIKLNLNCLGRLINNLAKESNKYLIEVFKFLLINIHP